jgi:hypothetical protein
VFFLPSQQVLPTGFRSMRLDSPDGVLLTEAAGANSPDALISGFTSADLPAQLRVGVFMDTPHGELRLEDAKTVLVPPVDVDAAATVLRFEVRPTLSVLTLRVKARVNLPVLLEPDTTDLDAQLAQRGIDLKTLAKAPDFKLAPEMPPSFDATLLVYTGKLTIQQVL